MQLDRRRKRSNYTALSLHYWLAAIAERTPAFAYVLADPTGLLVASSIRGPEAEELAAVAPILARPDANGIQVAKRYGVPMCIEEIEIDGMQMLLCAVGDREACRTALPQVADGVGRILTN
jgi:hypothetical protein